MNTQDELTAFPKTGIPAVHFPRRLSIGQLGIKKKLASTAFRTMRSLGAFSVSAGSRRRHSRLLILCYHGISLNDEHKWLPLLYITREQFRQRLAMLRQARASVLPLDEAIVRLQNGSLPHRSVTITFDDGFYDFLHHAVPLLSEFGYPATVYLTTHYCDHRLPIIGLMLDYLLWKSGQQFVTFPRMGVPETLPVRNYAERQRVVTRILGWTERQHLNTVEKNQVARSMAAQFGLVYDHLLQSRMLQIMDASEVRRAVNAGVDIQLHTHRHRTPRDRSLFLKEIEDNRNRIVDLTGKVPVHFCYPSGDYSPELFEWLNGYGVRSATTCDNGLALRSSPSMRLPRVLDHTDLHALRFESAVSGFLV